MFCWPAVVTATVLLALSAPAQATIVDVMYTGVVASGADVTGVFGWPGDLAGAPFTASFRFDVDGAACSRSAYATDCVGGVAYGSSSPNLGATLRIGDATITFSGDQSGEISATNFVPLGLNPFSEQSHSATHASTIPDGDAVRVMVDVLTLSVYGPNGDLPASVDAPFSRDLTAEQVNASFAVEDALYDPSTGDSAANAFAYGELRPLTLTETIESDVPEPGAWALMLTGMALAGAAARNRWARPTRAG